MSELLSCIMVTKNRKKFFAQALHYFLRQSYQNAELIVVDDGEDSVEALCQGHARVRYIRATGPATTGSKMNLGISHAKGELIQKLDDDDYYHPDFLQLAMEHMPRENRDNCLLAWDRFLVCVLGDNKLMDSGNGWVIGNSLLFTKTFWSRGPFKNQARGSDTLFIHEQPCTHVRVDAPEHCIVIRHGANTWTDMKSGEMVDDYFRRFRPYPKSLREVVGDADFAFYENLHHTQPHQAKASA